MDVEEDGELMIVTLSGCGNPPGARRVGMVQSSALFHASNLPPEVRESLEEIVG